MVCISSISDIILKINCQTHKQDTVPLIYGRLQKLQNKLHSNPIKTSSLFMYEWQQKSQTWENNYAKHKFK